MDQSSVPHLCGGILFCLLLETRKPRRKARNKLNGGTDGLTAPDVFAGLIHVVTGEDESLYKTSTLEKCASDYKKCQTSTGDYVPFTKPGTASAFDSEIKRNNPDLLQRMSGFVDKYLNVAKCEWLVRTIIETIQGDKEIDNSTEFAVDYDCYMQKQKLHTVRNVALYPFMLSVLQYVLLHSADAESGRPTFEAWYTQSSPRAEWKLNRKDLGDTIDPISISTDLPTAATAAPAPHTAERTATTDPAEEIITADTRSDRQVISEHMMESLSSVLAVLEAHKLPEIKAEQLIKPLGYIAAAAAAQEHQMAEDIRKNEAKKKAAAETQSDPSAQTDKTSESDSGSEHKAEGTVVHQTIVNQYGDHPVHIDHVENLKL